MRAKLREHIEALLFAERNRASSDLHQIEEDEAEAQPVSSGELARSDWDPDDVASDVQEEESDFIAATRTSAHLAEIDAALRLLARNPDQLAHCARCAREIEPARLQIVPWSRLCADCARANGRLA